MEQYKDLNLIRTFVRVVEMKSFTQAAKSLQLQKSKVSRQISQLENELGAQLLYRSTRTFQLTEMGRRLFNNTRAAIQSLDDVKTQGDEQISGLIRLTAPSDWSGSFLPEILEEFRRQYPGIRYEVILSQESLNLVEEKIDVAFRVGNPRGQAYRMRVLGDIEFVFVGHPRYVGFTPDRLEDIGSAPIVIQSDFGTLNPLHFVSKGKKIKIKLNPVCISNNPHLVSNLVQKGMGLSLLPRFLVADEIKDGRLVTFFDDYKAPSMQLSILTPFRKEVPESVKLFTELAAKKIKEQLRP